MPQEPSQQVQKRPGTKVYSFTIRVLKRQDGGNYLVIIQAVYDAHYTKQAMKHSIYNLKQDKHTHSLHLILQVFKVLEERNERKKLKTEKKEAKLSEFTGNLDLYSQDPEDCLKILELISTFSKMPGQKLVQTHSNFSVFQQQPCQKEYRIKQYQK